MFLITTFRAAAVFAAVATCALLVSPPAALAQRASLGSIQDALTTHDLSVQNQLGVIQSTLAGPLSVTTETEQSARTPFSANVSVAFGKFRGIDTADRVAGDDFTVPAGNILVVEHISLRATMAVADLIGYVEVSFRSNGASTSHHLPVRGDLRSLPVGSTQKIETHGWPVKFYADPETDVVLNLNSTVGSPGGAVVYRVSGYLVPAASPTLGQ